MYLHLWLLPCFHALLSVFFTPHAEPNFRLASAQATDPLYRFSCRFPGVELTPQAFLSLYFGRHFCWALNSTFAFFPPTLKMLLLHCLLPYVVLTRNLYYSYLFSPSVCSMVSFTPLATFKIFLFTIVVKPFDGKTRWCSFMYVSCTWVCGTS